MRLRNFVFTLHNYTEEDITNLLTKLPKTYIVFAKEICPTTGTPHLQGYCELDCQLTRDQIKAKLQNETIHIDPRYGSQRRAIAYVKTPEDVAEWFEKGKRNPTPENLFEAGTPKRQGARVDLIIAREWIRSGRSVDPFDPDYTIGVQKAYEQIQKYVPYTGHYSKPRVIWHYGQGGSGKTQRAYEVSIGSVYKCDLLQYGWLDGYNGEETVLIDDVTVNESNRQQWFELLLKMTDRYPVRMNVKNSSCQYRPKLVIITSQEPPYALFGMLNSYELKDPLAWARDTELRQLMRRIDQLVECELVDGEELKFPEIIKHKTLPQ
jgi:hypothetical protein